MMVYPFSCVYSLHIIQEDIVILSINFVALSWHAIKIIKNSEKKYVKLKLRCEKVKKTHSLSEK